MKYGLKVNKSGYKKLCKNLKVLETKEVRAGFFREDKYTGSETTKRKDYNAGSHVAQIAIWNEYGSRANNRKPRPFLTLSFEDIRREQKALGKAIAAVMMGESYTSALSLLGEYYKKIIQKTIEYWWLTGDSNSPAWAKFKGFNRPLEFTKKMVESVKFKITKRFVSTGKE